MEGTEIATDLDDVVAHAAEIEVHGDWAGAAGLWRSCAFKDRISRRVWLSRYAYALVQSGATAEAAACYKFLRKAYHNDPAGPEGLALIESRQGNWTSAIEIFNGCLKRFPSHDNRKVWLEGRGYAAMEAGRYRLAHVSFDALSRAPGSELSGHRGKSWTFEREWKWTAAADSWSRCSEFSSPRDRSASEARRAECLIQIGKISEARQALVVHAKSLDGACGLARLSEMQDDPHIAAQHWDNCIAQFPDSPNGLLGKAQFLFRREAYAEADVLLLNVITRWPDLVEALVLRCRCAIAQRSWAAAKKHWAVALKRFPANEHIAREYVRYLGVLGRNSAAEAFLRSFRNRPAMYHRLLLEFALVSDDYDAAVNHARLVAELEPRDLWHRLRYADALVRQGTAGALRAALRLARNLYDQSPDSVLVRAQLANIYVRLAQDEEAQAILDTIPAEDHRLDVEVLRAWKCRSDVTLEKAKRRWDSILSRNYFPAIHARITDLARIDGNRDDVRSDEIVLFTAMRNEAARIGWFLSYYRALGVGKFVIVDNGSTDESQQRLLEENDVILYRTTDRYSAAGSGMRWINELIDRHGRKGWCLHVDADEALVYPGSEYLTLYELTSKMNAASENAMFCVMLDMYPLRTSDKDIGNIEGVHARYKAFDPDIYIRPHPVSPYREAFGGLRRKKFGVNVLLNKVPLIDGSAGIRYLLSAHQTTPAKISAATGALLHYHLAYAFEGSYRPQFQEAIERREFPSFSLERLRLDRAMHTATSLSLPACVQGTCFSSTSHLAKLGIIRASKSLRKSLDPAFGR